MAAEDYMVGDFFDEYAGEVICKTCGFTPLQWERATAAHNRKKWVLINDRGEIHDCRGAAKAEEFPRYG